MEHQEQVGPQWAQPEVAPPTNPYHQTQNSTWLIAQLAKKKAQR